MKDYYFTPKTIHKKSHQMLRNVEKYKEGHKIDFLPEHSALLIIDMQRYFLDKSSHAYIPNALPIISKIKDLANAFLKIGSPVILTRHLNKPGDANLMAKWWKDLIIEEDPLSEILPELNLSGTIVIKKPQYDAFYETPLEDLLKEKGVTQLVITGVMTHLCCETTARAAFVRGFTTFLPIDGTATYNEAFHRASLLNLSHGFSIPVLIEELQDVFKVMEKSEEVIK